VAAALAADGYRLVIAARDTEELAKVAADLEVRHRADVHVRGIDLCGDPAGLVDLVDETCALDAAAAGRLDVVVITAGMVSDDDDGFAAPELVGRIVATNFTGVMTVASAAAARMRRQPGGGSIVLFSSIAAKAPRGSNVAYAASKAALESYAASMQHALSTAEVKVQVVAPGYVDTAMTAGKELLLPVASPEEVATAVVEGLAGGRRFVYSPRWWGPIVGTIRRLPWPVYRRLDF